MSLPFQKKKERKDRVFGGSENSPEVSGESLESIGTVLSECFRDFRGGGADFGCCFGQFAMVKKFALCCPAFLDQN